VVIRKKKNNNKYDMDAEGVKKCFDGDLTDEKVNINGGNIN